MKKINFFVFSFLTILLFFYEINIYANNLLITYQQAFQHDPTYLKTKASDLGNQQLPDIARAALLPNISLGGHITTNKQFQQGGFHHGNGYNIALTQTVFDFSKWSNWKEQKATAKQAILNSASAMQNLMVRTASAYFAVVQAQTLLALKNEERANTLKLLRLTKQRYKSGQLTATDVANFVADSATEFSQIIAAETTLLQQHAKLQAITLQPSVKRLAQLKSSFSPIDLKPHNQRAWLQQTRKTNLSIQAQQYAVTAAKQQVTTNNAGHYPTLNLQSSYGDNKSEIGNLGNTRDRDFSATLRLALPIYQGGRVLTETKQAEYHYQAALENLSLTIAQTIDHTRESYIGVVNGIRQIKALKEAIAAHETALKDTVYLYRAGQQQSQDVIRAQNNLYSTKANLIQANYSYLINILKLKEAAGTLTIKDLAMVNSWLR